MRHPETALYLAFSGVIGHNRSNSRIAYDWFYSFDKKRGAGVDIGVNKIRSFPIKRCAIEV